MLGYKSFVRKEDFKISGEVDSVEWFPYESAVEKIKEGSIAWQLVKQVINEEIRG